MTRVLPLVVLFLAHLGAADDDYQFWDACAAGDDVVVRELLDAGVVDVEYPSEDGRSPLLIAVTEGHTAVARALIAAGAQLEAPGSFPFAEDTPLGSAAARGRTEMMATLLDAGAQVNGPSNDGRTPLMNAVVGGQLESALWLVERGADVHSVKADGTTALFWAAKAADPKLVAALINAGACLSPRAVSFATRTARPRARRGLTSVGYAARACARSPFARPRPGSNVSAVDIIDGSQPIHFAGQAGPWVDQERAAEVMRLLLAAGADPLARSLVLAPKPDPNAEEPSEPKHEDLKGGLTPLMTAAGAGCLGAIDALLEALPDDNDVKLYDIVGQTSIAWASQAGHAEAVKRLLARGASAMSYGADGRSPIHLAAFHGATSATFSALVKVGNVPVDLRSKEGHTAMTIAAFQARQAPLTLGSASR